MSFNDIAIATFGENSYSIHFLFMFKTKAVDKI